MQGLRLRRLIRTFEKEASETQPIIFLRWLLGSRLHNSYGEEQDRRLLPSENDGTSPFQRDISASSQRCLHCQEGNLIMWKDGRATFTLLLPVVCCILAALRCLTCHVFSILFDIRFLLHGITPLYPVWLAVSPS